MKSLKPLIKQIIKLEVELHEMKKLIEQSDEYKSKAALLKELKKKITKFHHAIEIDLDVEFVKNEK